MDEKTASKPAPVNNALSLYRLSRKRLRSQEEAKVKRIVEAATGGQSPKANEKPPAKTPPKAPAKAQEKPQGAQDAPPPNPQGNPPGANTGAPDGAGGGNPAGPGDEGSNETVE